MFVRVFSRSGQSLLFILVPLGWDNNIDDLRKIWFYFLVRVESKMLHRGKISVGRTHVGMDGVVHGNRKFGASAYNDDLVLGWHWTLLSNGGDGLDGLDPCASFRVDSLGQGEKFLEFDSRVEVEEGILVRTSVS